MGIGWVGASSNAGSSCPLSQPLAHSSNLKAGSLFPLPVGVWDRFFGGRAQLALGGGCLLYLWVVGGQWVGRELPRVLL